MVKKMTPAKVDQQLADIMGLFEDAYSAYEERRRDRELENLDFVRGKQFVDAGTAGATQLEEDELPVVENIVRPIVEAAVASRLRQMPQIAIASLRGDIKARARAKASEGLCQAALHNGVIDWDEIERVANWAETCGLGYIKWFWDPKAGRQKSNPDPEAFWEEADDGEESEMDPFGTEVKEQLAEGDVRIMFVPSSDGLPNADARSWREVRHFFHVRLMPVAEILDMFPEDQFGKKLTPGDLDTGANAYGGIQSQVRMVEQDDEGLGTASNELGNELAQLVEFWELPTQKYKNGRFAIFSGSRMIHVGPNWLEPRRLPFVPYFGSKKVPASLYPDGVVEDIKSPQRVMNRVVTKQLEHADKVLNAHLLVPYEAGINLNTWGKTPGQMIKYRTGFKPEFVDTPQIPPTTFDLVEQTKATAQEISGFSDIVRGVNVGAEASGRSQAFARENQEIQREPVMMSHRNSMIAGLQQYLWYVRQFYDDGRLINVLGENDTFEAIEFFAEDFDLDSELVVDVYNGAPTSPAMILSEALEIHERGGFEDTPGAERLRAILGKGYSRALTFDPFQADRQRARREELIIARGWPMQILAAPFDNHRVHLDCHNEFRKTYEYEKLSPQQRQMFDMHCAQHEEMEMLAQFDFGQQQQWLQGGAGGAPALPAGPEAGFEGPRSPMDGGNSMLPEEQQAALQPMGGDPGGAAAQDAGATTFEPMPT